MIDFHVHTAPDTAERTVTAVEAARAARDKGLRSIVGVESSILASDMGAVPVGIPADGFAAFVARLRELGMTDAELDRVGRKNPAALLGLP